MPVSWAKVLVLFDPPIDSVLSIVHADILAGLSEKERERCVCEKGKSKKVKWRINQWPIGRLDEIGQILQLILYLAL